MTIKEIRNTYKQALNSDEYKQAERLRELARNVYNRTFVRLDKPGAKMQKKYTDKLITKLIDLLGEELKYVKGEEIYTHEPLEKISIHCGTYLTAPDNDCTYFIRNLDDMEHTIKEPIPEGMTAQQAAQHIYERYRTVKGRYETLERRYTYKDIRQMSTEQQQQAVKTIQVE